MCGGVCGGARRCAEGCAEVRGGARRCAEGCAEVRGGARKGVRRGAWRGAWRGTYGFLKKLLKNFTLNFLGKMVDISTWRCRIGTFSQKSKKVFYVLNSQGKKVIVTSCYFSCFVVSVNVALNLLFI